MSQSTPAVPAATSSLADLNNAAPPLAPQYHESSNIRRGDLPAWANASDEESVMHANPAARIRVVRIDRASADFRVESMCQAISRQGRGRQYRGHANDAANPVPERDIGHNRLPGARIG